MYLHGERLVAGGCPRSFLNNLLRFVVPSPLVCFPCPGFPPFCNSIAIMVNLKAGRLFYSSTMTNAFLIRSFFFVYLDNICFFISSKTRLFCIFYHTRAIFYCSSNKFLFLISIQITVVYISTRTIVFIFLPEQQLFFTSTQTTVVIHLSPNNGYLFSLQATAALHFSPNNSFFLKSSQ